jgi:carotenoid cleavage dioxygenase
MARLQMLTLDMASGRSRQQSFEQGNQEFPRIDPRRIGLPARWLLSASGWRPGADHQGALRHGVQLFDTQAGRLRRFDYGADAVAEEHLLIPRPGGQGELDAWLLGTSFDSRRRATVLNLLEAAHIEDGPIAEAVLPYMLPLGFHGNFSAA